MKWKPIIDAPRYEVSDTGAVRNAQAGKVLKPWPHHRSGHLWVGLGAAGRFQVHHLVLAAFRGPRPAGQVGRHHDDNPANNRIGNLFWGTHAENIGDYVRLHHKYPRSATTFEVEQRIAAVVRVAPRGKRPDIAAWFGVTVNVVNRIAKQERTAEPVAKAA